MSTHDQLPVAFSDCDRAVLAFVASLSDRWSGVDWNNRTEAEQEALFRMAASDLVTLRVQVSATWNGDTRFFECEASGEFRQALDTEVRKRLPDAWHGASMFWEPTAVRGTKFLTVAKGDLKERPWLILQTMSKWEGMPWVRVKPTTGEHSSSKGPHSQAIAAAQAIGGDTTVNNQVVVNVQPQPSPDMPAMEPTPAEVSPPLAPTMIRFTKAEAAKYVGVAPKTLDRWMKNHKISWTDIGDMQIEFNLAELDAHRAVKKEAD